MWWNAGAIFSTCLYTIFLAVSAVRRPSDRQKIKFFYMSADEMAQLYRSVMTGLLDKHCPVVTIRRKTKHTTPWFDFECRAQRRRVRAAERRFLWTCCEVDRQKWLAKLKLLHALYELKNSTYRRDEIAASKGNMRKLWRSLSGVLGETSSDVFDDHSAADFAAFSPTRLTPFVRPPP